MDQQLSFATTQFDSYYLRGYSNKPVLRLREHLERLNQIHILQCIDTFIPKGGRRSPAVACWASDHWIASLNPLRGKFRH